MAELARQRQEFQDNSLDLLFSILEEELVEVSAALSLFPVFIRASFLLEDHTVGQISGDGKGRVFVNLNGKLCVNTLSALSAVCENPTSISSIHNHYLTQLIFTLAHELAHIRQLLHIEAKHFAKRYFELEEEALAYLEISHDLAKRITYLTSTKETHANAIAIRYIRAKLAVASTSFPWRLLDFNDILANELEELGTHINLRNLINLSGILTDFPPSITLQHIRDQSTINIDQNRLRPAEIFLKKLDKADTVMNKAHEKLGTTMPPTHYSTDMWVNHTLLPRLRR